MPPCAAVSNERSFHSGVGGRSFEGMRAIAQLNAALAGRVAEGIADAGLRNGLGEVELEVEARIEQIVYRGAQLHLQCAVGNERGSGTHVAGHGLRAAATLARAREVGNGVYRVDDAALNSRIVADAQVEAGLQVVFEGALLAAHPEGQLEAGGRVAQPDGDVGRVQLGYLVVGRVQGYGTAGTVLQAAGYVVDSR
nr:hypothetical protein [Tanacetum cinerariifolium]